MDNCIMTDRGGLPGAERVRDADDFYFYDHPELLWWSLR